MCVGSAGPGKVSVGVHEDVHQNGPSFEASLESESLSDDSWWDDLDVDAIQPTLQRLSALLAISSPSTVEEHEYPDPEARFLADLRVTKHTCRLLSSRLRGFGRTNCLLIVPVAEEADVQVQALAQTGSVGTPDWSTVMIREICTWLSSEQSETCC